MSPSLSKPRTLGPGTIAREAGTKRINVRAKGRAHEMLNTFRIKLRHVIGGVLAGGYLKNDLCDCCLRKRSSY